MSKRLECVCFAFDTGLPTGSDCALHPERSLRAEVASLRSRAEKAEAALAGVKEWVGNLSKRAGCWSHADSSNDFCPYCGQLGAAIERAEKAEADRDHWVGLCNEAEERDGKKYLEAIDLRARLRRAEERAEELTREIERRDEMLSKPEERALWADTHQEMAARLRRAEEALGELWQQAYNMAKRRCWDEAEREDSDERRTWVLLMRLYPFLSFSHPKSIEPIGAIDRPEGGE